MVSNFMLFNLLNSNFLENLPCEMNGYSSSISLEDCQKYEKFFRLLQENGFVDGKKARTFFLKSGLSTSVLAEIWKATDQNKDGKLNHEEFLTACHMTSAVTREKFRQNGAIERSSVHRTSMSNPSSPVHFKYQDQSDINRRNSMAPVLSESNGTDSNRKSWNFSEFAITLPKNGIVNPNWNLAQFPQSVFPDKGIEEVQMSCS